MPIVIQLPEVKGQETNRPHKCPHCKGETFQRWGQHRKRIKDLKMKSVRVYRYRCTVCRRTFRHYPEGVSRAQQSERMKQLAAICWTLGLSYRGIEQILSAFGIRLSRMSSWRDVQAAAERLRGRTKWKAARLVGVDGAWLNGQGVMVAVDRTLCENSVANRPTAHYEVEIRDFSLLTIATCGSGAIHSPDSRKLRENQKQGACHMLSFKVN